MVTIMLKMVMMNLLYLRALIIILTHSNDDFNPDVVISDEGDDDEFASLVARYAVPAHAAIVLSLAARPPSAHVQEWSFAHSVHPAVLNALFHTMCCISSCRNQHYSFLIYSSLS